MPPIAVVWSTWRADWVAIAVVMVAALGYGFGLRNLRRQRLPWPLWRVLAFYLLGLGTFVVLSCGFPGAYGGQLRWAYTIKLSMYLFVVPVLVGLGQPLTLASAALSERGAARLHRWAVAPPVRLLSNPIVAPLIGLLLFLLFLTPFFATMRGSAPMDGVLTVAVPVAGLLMILPNLEESFFARAASLLMLEFVFVFIELLCDAVPGILLRLSNTVLDHVTSWPVPHPPWFPSPLGDQRFAGDFLWCIAEVVDLPLIVLMFVRVFRNEARDVRHVDELSDEEFAELARAHLGHRDQP